MSLHAPSEMGFIEARARRRWERYREHWESEHWHIGTVPPGMGSTPLSGEDRITQNRDGHVR